MSFNPPGLQILPEGVVLHTLALHADVRGSLVECFRASWPSRVQPVQWNIVRSGAGVLRGFHVHVTHGDYLLMAEGRMLLGLKDIRTDSATAGRNAFLELNADAPVAVSIPPGVAHGFLFPERAIHVYAVSEYWSEEDELGCRWNDPGIGLDWPIQKPTLSPRDEAAGGFDGMVREFEARKKQKEAGGARPGS